MQNEKKLAVLIDADNASAKSLKQIMDEVTKATRDKETAVPFKSFSSLKSLSALRPLEGGANG